MAERLVLAPESNPGPTVAVSARDPLEGGDIDRWTLDQAEFLRASRWDQVDLVNVADGDEDVGKSDYTPLDSKLEITSFTSLNGSINLKDGVGLGRTRFSSIAFGLKNCRGAALD